MTSTTTLLVEMLVIGITALVSAVILFASLYGVTAGELVEKVDGLEGLAVVAGVVLTAFAYQLGWAINGVFCFVLRGYDGRVLAQSFKLGEVSTEDAERVHREAEVLILLKGGTEIINDLRTEVSAIRLSRAAVPVLLMSAISLLVSQASLAWPISGPLFLCALLCTWYTTYRNRRYYDRKAIAYRVLSEVGAAKQNKPTAGAADGTFGDQHQEPL